MSDPATESTHLTPGLSISIEGGHTTAFVPADAKPGEVEQLQNVLGFLGQVFGPGESTIITVVDELPPYPPSRFEPGAGACTE